MIDKRMAAAALGFLLMGCNAVQRPEIIEQASNEDEVVALPGGGALIMRRLRDEPRCFVRARFFRGLVQRPCSEIAQEVRP